MADVKPEPNITMLTFDVEKLTNQLRTHTDNRAYLFELLNQETLQPMPILKLCTPAMPGVPETVNVMINLRQLDSMTYEDTIAGLMIQEEKSAIACWKELQRVVGKANEILIKREQAKTTSAASAPEFDDAPLSLYKADVLPLRTTPTDEEYDN